MSTSLTLLRVINRLHDARGKYKQIRGYAEQIGRVRRFNPDNPATYDLVQDVDYSTTLRCATRHARTMYDLQRAMRNDLQVGAMSNAEMDAYEWLETCKRQLRDAVRRNGGRASGIEPRYVRDMRQQALRCREISKASAAEAKALAIPFGKQRRFWTDYHRLWTEFGIGCNHIRRVYDGNPFQAAAEVGWVYSLQIVPKALSIKRRYNELHRGMAKLADLPEKRTGRCAKIVNLLASDRGILEVVETGVLMRAG